MTQKAAVIFGATGLTGSQLLGELLDSEHYANVYAFTRRSLEVEHEKLTVTELPLEKISAEDIQHLPGSLDVFLCLGTTISKAGSKDAFRKVDYFLPMKLVNLFKNKSDHFLLISSLGADPASSSFYLSVKGQLEEDLRVLDINQLTIFRPSLLKGDRHERRFLEGVSIKLSGLMTPLFNLKFMQKYRPTESRDLARLMYKVAVEGVGLSSARTNVISSDMITRLLTP
ncbi:hypothetical protein ACFOEK_09085 [Litoribrevibacter euphylliae]|uniref:Oxidoreductase n=1 Tax=Litoribrevibacter euphylliae TaxID=1834034 RepID=A0ABV7HF22_9GAMM